MTLGQPLSTALKIRRSSSKLREWTVEFFGFTARTTIHWMRSGANWLGRKRCGLRGRSSRPRQFRDETDAWSRRHESAPAPNPAIWQCSNSLRDGIPTRNSPWTKSSNGSARRRDASISMLPRGSDHRVLRGRLGIATLCSVQIRNGDDGRMRRTCPQARRSF